MFLSVLWRFNAQDSLYLWKFVSVLTDLNRFYVTQKNSIIKYPAIKDNYF